MRLHPAALVCAVAILAGACSDDTGETGTDAPEGPTTTTGDERDGLDPADQDGSSTTTTTTATPEQLEDGIVSPEDTAAFLATSWFDGDRQRALRHADAGAVDELFAHPAPPVESVEFVECDTADLERFDCFFVVDGRRLVVEVVDLRATRVDLDAP